MFAGHLKDVRFCPLGQSVGVAVAGLALPALLEVSWLTHSLLGLAASTSTCGPVGCCCAGGFWKVRGRGTSHCVAAGWECACKACAPGCQSVLSVRVLAVPSLVRGQQSCPLLVVAVRGQQWCLLLVVGGLAVWCGSGGLVCV